MPSTVLPEASVSTQPVRGMTTKNGVSWSAALTVAISRKSIANVK